MAVSRAAREGGSRSAAPTEIRVHLSRSRSLLAKVDLPAAAQVTQIGLNQALL